MNLPYKRVVVTGLGALTPLGNNVSDYWNGLVNGVSGADFIQQFDVTKFKTKFACELKGFNPEDYFDRKEARKLDRFSQLAVAAAKEAVEQSGINDPALDHDRIGVIWASGIGGMITFIEEMKNFNAGDGTPRFNPFFIPKLILDIASGHISMKYGFRGPNFSTVSACASSTNALIDALTYIRIGKANAIVTAIQILKQLPVLSIKNGMVLYWEKAVAPSYSKNWNMPSVAALPSWRKWPVAV